MKEFAVELKNVIKKFGQVTAVNNVSLKILDGEFFSLLGPSGCGKTTTLRLIGGFELPTEGQILIQGEPQGFKPPFRRPVNTVFQNYALFPHMNVFQNVAFGLQMQKIPKAEIEKRVNETLEMVHLPKMGNRKPNQLSGGQQQRIALARALINQPQVLLLDEPLGALDLKLRKAMQLELKDLQQRVGITFIYVTHDQEEALTMSDRIAVMEFGKVLQLGSPEEIYEKPANVFVADFIGETNFVDARVISINSNDVDLLLEDKFNVTSLLVSNLSTNQEVSLAVRPEKLSITRSRTEGISIPGIVKEVIYIGTDIRYEVTISDKTTVAIREQNRGNISLQRFEKGERVFLGWEEASATILTM
ncbi:MAG: ABC transporter ATP-binding protein [Anaerolineales bacterium]